MFSAIRLVLPRGNGSHRRGLVREPPPACRIHQDDETRFCSCDVESGQGANDENQEVGKRWLVLPRRLGCGSWGRYCPAIRSGCGPLSPDLTPFASKSRWYSW